MPLISKPIKEFTPDEYHAHVKSMYALRKEPKVKADSKTPGLKLKRTKKGALSITRTKKTRAFDYVLKSELDFFASTGEYSLQDLWVAFKQKSYIIAETKMEAERINASILGIPWEHT